MKHDLNDFIETRHFLFEWGSADALRQFLDALKKTSKEIKIFRGNIGEIYISIKGIFDGSDVLNIETTEDILHDFRKKGMKRIREFSRKPSPQRSFRGDWISIL